MTIFITVLCLGACSKTEPSISLDNAEKVEEVVKEEIVVEDIKDETKEDNKEEIKEEKIHRT